MEGGIDLAPTADHTDLGAVEGFIALSAANHHLLAFHQGIVRQLAVSLFDTHKVHLIRNNIPTLHSKNGSPYKMVQLA
jgi:hypothetical protein